jgi:ferredoxin-NADP reductase
VTDKKTYYPLSVSRIIKESEDAISIALIVPENRKELFVFDAGQYLNLKLEIDGETHLRSYSLSNSPGSNSPLTITVKRVKDGIVSNYLNDNAAPGFDVEVMPPMGNFTLDEIDDGHHIVCFAGGSGITPLISIVETALRTQPQSKITLIYSNRTLNDMLFADRIAHLLQAHSDRFNVQNVFTKTSGRLTRVMVADLHDYKLQHELQTHYFICGPGGMMEEVDAALQARRVDENNIHIEYFSARFSDAEHLAAKQGKAKVDLDFYGKSIALEAPKNRVLLDTFLAQKIDAPYSCYTGICGTCIAQLTKGKVEHNNDAALRPKDRKNNMILCCQAYPVSDEVEVVFGTDLA